jgi:hypothetical protein
MLSWPRLFYEILNYVAMLDVFMAVRVFIVTGSLCFSNTTPLIGQSSSPPPPRLIMHLTLCEPSASEP